MSTQDRGTLPLNNISNSKKKVGITIDLNAPVGNQGLEGTSTEPVIQVEQTSGQGGSRPPTPIDLEAVDDDVIISSESAFQEAKNKSKRNQGRHVVVDVDSGDWAASMNQNKHQRVGSNQTSINCDLYISNSSKIDKAQHIAPPPAPPKEPSFSCPVCMGPLVDEMSTKCGHIFCMRCIQAAVAAQHKCPTCRRKLAKKDLIRVYLPATS